MNDVSVLRLGFYSDMMGSWYRLWHLFSLCTETTKLPAEKRLLSYHGAKNAIVTISAKTSFKEAIFLHFFTFDTSPATIYDDHWFLFIAWARLDCNPHIRFRIHVLWTNAERAWVLALSVLATSGYTAWGRPYLDPQSSMHTDIYYRTWGFLEWKIAVKWLSFFLCVCVYTNVTDFGATAVGHISKQGGELNVLSIWDAWEY